MTRFQQDEAITPVAVLECGPEEDSGHEEDGRRILDQLCLDEERRNLLESGFRVEHGQDVMFGVIVVETWFEAVYRGGHQIQLQRVECPARRHDTERTGKGRPDVVSGDAVAEEQDLCQGVQWDCALGEGSGRLPGLQYVVKGP